MKNNILKYHKPGVPLWTCEVRALSKSFKTRTAILFNSVVFCTNYRNKTSSVLLRKFISDQNYQKRDVQKQGWNAPTTIS